MVSVSLPEKGLDMAADMVNRVITRPFLSAPPRLEIKSLSSGRIKLKLVIKKNTSNHISNIWVDFLIASKNGGLVENVEVIKY